MLAYAQLTVHFAEKGLVGDPKQVRQMLESFAGAKGFNPLIPENWYNIEAQELLTIKVARFTKYHTLTVNAGIQNGSIITLQRQRTGVSHQHISGSEIRRCEVQH